MTDKALQLLASLGRPFYGALVFMGSLSLFLLDAVRQVRATGRVFSRFMRQVYAIGSQSLFLIILISLFCGMVLGLQGYYTLLRFGSVGFLGSMVSLSLIRELGPVLTAIMLTGRAGSSMTAEIGVMRISDQIDALDVMDINPVSYLISPRLMASLVCFPLLTAVFNTVGIIGGYLTAVAMLDMNQGAYFYRISSSVCMADISCSFLKAVVFGVLVTIVCCHQGYYANRRRDSVGPEAVGNATTSAVVTACVLILAADYVLTSIFL